MERNTQKNGLINLLALVVMSVAAYAVAHYTRTLSGLVSVAFMVLGVLVAAVSWFQMGLQERERLEKLEFDELTKAASSSALFNAAETEVFPAQRSREQFERYFLPAFTVLLFLLESGGALLAWLALARHAVQPLENPLVCTGLFGMFFLLLFLLGRFASGLARLENLRLLRPGATLVLLNAYLCAVVLVGVGGTWAGFIRFDLYVARALAGLLFLIGVETLISLVLEMYRPRVKGKVDRPVYESKLISMLGQPEGLFATAAHTLDYQFGFKVSETWIYRLLKQLVLRLVLIQFVVLLLSTMVVFIDPGEQAILEHAGKPKAVLGPGAHLKFPWPIDRAYRFPAEQIQTLSVGFTPENGVTEGNTVLWTVNHADEENFLVANHERPASGSDTNTPFGGALAATSNPGTKPPPPVSLLTVSVPVHFQITNIEEWVYNNDQPASLLQDIATRQVVRFLVNVDLEELISKGRSEAAQKLEAGIQAEANRLGLGVNILFVGLEDCHPPVSVAGEYEKVVAAIHTREANILDAQAHQIMTNALADAQAYKTVSDARARAYTKVKDAEAQANLFTNQIQAYRAAPVVYANRAYLDMFARAVPDVRKYIVLATNTQDVVILNLEDRISADIMNDLTLPPPTLRPSAQPTPGQPAK